MQPPPPPTPPVAPRCVALVLADSITQDPETWTWSATAIYDRIVASELPVTYASMEVYVALTNGHGDCLIELQLVDREDAQPPIFRQLMLVRFESPLETYELVYRQYRVSIPEEGIYRLRLYAHPAGLAREGHGVFILERTVTVTLGA